MSSKKNVSFKETVRQTFILYALIPAIFFILIAFISGNYIFYKGIIKVNQRVNTDTSTLLEQTASCYMKDAMSFTVLPETIEAMKRGKADSWLCAKLYEYVGSHPVRPNFFLADANNSILTASTGKVPGYIMKAPIFNIGICRKARQNPEIVNISIEAAGNSQRVITFGKSVCCGDEYLGLLVFELNQRAFSEALGGFSSGDLIITDRYNYVCWSTNSLIINKLHKLRDDFQDKTGFIMSAGNKFYIGRTEILDGEYFVYTISEMGKYNDIFFTMAIALALIFIVFFIFTFVASKVIADSKTEVIDKIVDTMSHVRTGEFDMPLVIHTGDEFEQIALSYNRMLDDIKKLISDNKEIIRQKAWFEVKQLETLFDPHFIFNTLELIKYMTRIEPQNVGKVIVGLSNLLRDSIDSSVSFVTLGQDKEYTENYLLIQHFRFGPRLNYSFNISDEAMDCIVPKRIIQPLVENAITYGADSKDQCNVNIGAHIYNGDLVIVIEDEGNGIEAEKLEEIRGILRRRRNTSKHNGLYNVHRRISLIYGDQYGLEISSCKRGTNVTLTLPNRKEPLRDVESFGS